MTDPSVGDASAAPTPTTLPPTWLERLVDLYRETARSRTALVLLVANAIPLVGVLFLSWSLWTILVIYWVENGIVGLWNLPRILLAEGQLLPGRQLGVGYRPWAVTTVPALGRTGLAVFFALHYGLFWLVHGVLVLVLPSFMGLIGPTRGPTFVPLFPGNPSSPLVPGSDTVGQGSLGSLGRLDWSAVALAAGGLFLSHAASFVFDYLRRGEFRRTWAAAQTVAPYGRVVVLHVTILLGGFAIAFLGAPLAMLLVLVVLKTGLDLRLHLGAQRPPAIRMQPI
ncbi:MAG TPA: DUF6498-containing protein [Candidatus Limnocylindrales bacterium]|nr:DUF6498-containing protein [Candidatus Limnocylindrales bacterium]